jgi:hypothetical protein
VKKHLSLSLEILYKPVCSENKSFVRQYVASDIYKTIVLLGCVFLKLSVLISLTDCYQILKPMSH